MNDSKPGRMTLNAQVSTATATIPSMAFCMVRFLSATELLVVTSAFLSTQSALLCLRYCIVTVRVERFSVRSPYELSSLLPRVGTQYTAAQLSVCDHCGRSAFWNTQLSLGGQFNDRAVHVGRYGLCC